MSESIQNVLYAIRFSNSGHIQIDRDWIYFFPGKEKCIKKFQYAFARPGIAKQFPDKNRKLENYREKGNESYAFRR